MKHLQHRFGIRCCLPLLMFLLLGGALSAQQIVSASEIEENTQWVGVDQAIPILKTQIDSWHAQLPGLQTGSPEHVNALRHAAYYKAIASGLMRGQRINDAMESALPWAASLGGAMEATYTTKEDLRSLYDEARDLLTK